MSKLTDGGGRRSDCAYKVIAYTVMAYIVMAQMVIAYIVMAYVFMAYLYGLYSHGPQTEAADGLTAGIDGQAAPFSTGRSADTSVSPIPT